MTPPAEAARRRPGSRSAAVVRVAGHLVAWSVILVPALTELTKGWRPLFDDATISTRAFQVFSTHPPWLGQYSQASHGGHPAFGLGPLQYWLLAIPVHLDPAQGALWGAAIVSGLALSLAVEAAWWRAGAIGCAVVAAVVVDLAWTEPSVFGNLVWNPNMGLVFFVATVVLACVVATGSVGWWPALVVTASVAAQCHLIFALTAAALALVAPVAAVIRGWRPGRVRWLWAGIGAGVLCWIAPLVQQFTGNPGNMTTLAHNGPGQAGLGIGWGLQVLATAAAPHPIWLTRSPTTFLPTLVQMYGHSSTAGVVVLCVTVAAAVVAWAAGRRDLAVVAAMAAICSLGTVASFAALPSADILLLTYLHLMWWVPGILLWAVAGWAVVVASRGLVRHLRPRREAGGHGWDAARSLTRWTARWGPAVAGAVTAAALAVTAFFGVRALVVPTAALGYDWAGAAQVDRIAPAVEALVPAGPVVVVVQGKTGPLATRGVALGLLWRLTADGWHPALPFVLGAALGSTVAPGPQWPVVVVTMDTESAPAGVVRLR